MINGLNLGCSDHCLLRNIENIMKKKIIGEKNFFFGFFGFFGISIPGDHVITRDCMVFQCMVKKRKKNWKKKNFFFGNFW